MASKKRIPIIFWNQNKGPGDTPEILKDHDTKVRIHTGWLDFFSPPLLACTLFIASVMLYGRHSIKHYFIAGEVPLNSLIVGGILFALARITMNIVAMRNAAVVLRNIELTALHSDITIQDVNALHKEVHKKGHIIDTKYMANVIDKLLVYGTLSFSNEEARLIKSKIGQRCAHNRTSAGFLAGLLIMMGLLGTYLGLLETIDKVGKAMAGMANIGGSGGASDSGMSSDQMSGFIGSIAAPLQGMGLAFSASLFGIGGSLIVSFMNYLSGHIQNDYIENVGRWLDENIPQAGPKAEKAASAPEIPGSADLKPWLAAFAQLSQRTHKKMGQLIVAMSHTVRLLASQKSITDQVGARHEEMSNALNAIQKHLVDFKGQSHETAVKSEQHLRNVDRTLTAIAAETEATRDSNREVANSLKAFNAVAENMKSMSTQVSAGIKAINDNIGSLNTSLKGASGAVSSDIKAILSSIESQESVSKSLAGSITDLRTGIDNFAKVEKDITAGALQQLKAAGPVAPVKNEDEVANLVWQLNSLLDEIAEGNTDEINALLKKQPKT